MQFIDTHCHLDFFTDTYPDIIHRAQQAGVSTIVAPATNTPSANHLVLISTQHDAVFIGVGIHPEDVTTEGYWSIYPQTEVDKIEAILQNQTNSSIQPIKAIGECGLDFKSDSNEKQKEIQIQLFKQHLDWAQRFDLPLIIHNRKANQELLSLLSSPITYNLKPKTYSGVFHCFSGSKAFAKQVIDLGFYVGIGGLLTLDQGLQQVVKTIPLEKIVLETDAPYLTPKQIRDQKPWPNEPANIPLIAQRLAEIKQVDIETIAEFTTKNAKELFSLP